MRDAALFLREYALGLVVSAGAGRGDFLEHSVCEGNKLNPSVVGAISSVFLVKDFGDRIFLLLRDFSRNPNVD